jgi:hypothetical protein
MLPQPDCCDDPTLLSLLTVEHAPDGEVVLKQCTHCLTFWRVTVQDRMRLDGLADELTESYESVTPEYGHDLLFGRIW